MPFLDKPKLTKANTVKPPFDQWSSDGNSNFNRLKYGFANLKTITGYDASNGIVKIQNNPNSPYVTSGGMVEAKNLTGRYAPNLS